MTAIMLSHAWSSFSPLLFAQDNAQDLDFEDELEDFEDPRHRPPHHRWVAFILIILLAIGVWYVVTDQETRSSMIRMVPDTVRARLDFRAEDPTPQRDLDVSPPSNAPPVPAFHEGQRVAVVPREGRQAHFRLRNEAEGEQRGPLVKPGDVLTVIDGSLIKQRWIYFVQTKSGDSGWIKEMDLQPRS